MNRSRLHLILYTAALAVLLTGCGAELAMKRGDRAYEVGEYFEAASQYKKAYAHIPTQERAQRGRTALRMADCYRRIGYTQRAIAAYRNAIRYGQSDSLTHIHLAQQLLKNGQYKEAEKEITNQLQASPQLLISAQQAHGWKRQGSRYTVKREQTLCSRRSEYSPVLTADGDAIYFTSTRNEATGDELSGITGTKNADIFVSHKDEQGRWQRPQPIDTELNTTDDEGACCLSPDGKTMYLTRCKTDATYPRLATIVTARRTDAAWTAAQPLTLTRDTLSLYAHPAVSPDGEWLYFVSDMPGGMGGKDIWRVRITESGLGGVENLGPPINTAGDELFPTFRPNGDLYFSSDGHPGLGGLDIYIAKQVHGSQFTVEHPGYPLNSQGDDFGMTFEGMLNRGYFASNRGDAHGWDHIYSFECPEVTQRIKGWVYEREGYELPQAVVYMVGNDGSNRKLSVRGDGSFTQDIEPGVDYVLLATCAGYLNHKEELRVEPVEESEEYTLQFPLASITAPVLIDNIFYDFDRATLRPESTGALDSLVTLLKTNPNVAIELSAHCDAKGSDDYNQRLSAQRARAVVDYLVGKGIERDRLTPVGYGKQQPKTVSRRQAERYPYLKTGDKLSEEFIAQLTPEQQEVCNQLNRRTEFRVVQTTWGMFDANGRLIESHAQP